MKGIAILIVCTTLNAHLLAQIDEGKIARKIAFLKESVQTKIKQYGEKSEEVINANFALLNIFLRHGKYNEAHRVAKKCLNNCSNVYGEKHPKTATAYSKLGKIYYYKREYSLSLEYFQNALSIRFNSFGEMNLLSADSYRNIASVYHKTSDYSKALKYYKKSLKINLSLLSENHSSIAAIYNNLGEVSLVFSDLKNAKKYFQNALEICLRIFGEKHSSTAITYNNFGELRLIKGDNQGAIEYFQKALRAFDKRYINIVNTQVNLAYAYENSSNYDLANTIWNMVIPNTKKQLKENYIFLTESKKMVYLNTIYDRYINFFHFMINHGNEKTKLLGADLLLNSKGQILDYAISTRQLIKNINNENLNSIVDKLNDINQKVAKAELLTNYELKQKGWNLYALRLQQDDLASQILAYPELNSKLNPTEFTWQEVKEKLQDNEVLIDYFTFYNKLYPVQLYYALLIKKEKNIPVFIPLSIGEPVVDLLQIRDKLPLYVQYRESRQEMYRYLWQALEPHLKNTETIHLSPVASLNKVDFESLQNENGQYLADLYDFHYYSSSKDFYKQKEGTQNFNDGILYGHIAYYEDDEQQYETDQNNFDFRLYRDSLRRLPATLQEIKGIEKICSKNNINATLLTIQEVKEDTIKFFSGDYAPGIIHFATHGAYLPPLNKKEEAIEMVSLTGQDRFRAADNPLQRSMLMLSNAGDTWKSSGSNIVTENDGILTALEVTNLDLSKTELVVLSACNSGIGSQHATEGVFGMPRAFKLAGVDKILVSLWPVEDETTKELMILFYTNLLQHKQDVAAALRNAKAEMRKRDDRPKKWAGFVLVE